MTTHLMDRSTTIFQDTNDSAMDLQARAGLYGHSMGAYSPMLALSVIAGGQTGEPSLPSLRSLVSGFMQWIAARRQRARLEQQLGHDVPVASEEVPVLLAEIERHKWLEAERAGRDIWAERNPRDPLAPAARHWFRNHFGAWYAHRQETLAA